MGYSYVCSNYAIGSQVCDLSACGTGDGAIVGNNFCQATCTECVQTSQCLWSLVYTLIESFIAYLTRENFGDSVVFGESIVGRSSHFLGQQEWIEQRCY